MADEFLMDFQLGAEREASFTLFSERVSVVWYGYTIDFFWKNIFTGT
jgi:hypothetical protein